MIVPRLRWLLLASFALLAGLCQPSPVSACPFCSGQGRPTLLGQYKKSDLVLFGKFANAKLDRDDSLGGGTTDFIIEKVLADKRNILEKKKKITLGIYLPKTKTKFLIYCEVYKDKKIDPVRVAEVEGTGDVVKYLKGALALKDKTVAARLRYCFDYLDSAEFEISQDAFQEFANADYKDYRTMAESLPADKIAGWLKNPKTQTIRFGLYASLLGHCGKEKHAKLIHQLLGNPDRWPLIGLDGMLAGYIMIKPKEGWTYLRGILDDPKQEFQLRYAGLKTVRFLWETRPDLVKQKDLVDGLCLLLKHTDVCDFVIEDLRRWKRWETADKVLALTASKTHDVPIIQRAILKFALSWPKKDARAKAFIADERKKDKEEVEEIEETLKAEAKAASKG
jgi:hypothetical protein